MPAVVSFSTQFDDPHKLAEELLAPLPHFTTQNALGILLCDSQVDIHTLLSLLGEALPMPLVGGTTLAFPLCATPGEDLSASLLIVTRPGMTISVAASVPLNEAGHMEQMREVYARAREQLQGEPRLLMPFFPLIPGQVTDTFITDLFLLAADIPVYGGITTGDLISMPAGVFAGGQVLADRMVLVMLGGDIRPVFAAANSMTPMSASTPVISQAEACTVFRVDDMSFCDYLRSVGIEPEDHLTGVDALMQYGPLPVKVMRPDASDDAVSEVRCINFTNLEEGSATFSGAMPEGARVRMGIMSRDDVTASAGEAMRRLVARMGEPKREGYAFSVLLCVSCAARYFVMAGGTNLEQELLAITAPRELAGVGYYGFCEIGPDFSADARCINRSYNASIALCAF